MLAAFSVTPLGVGEGVGEIVAEVVRVVRTSGLPNRTDAMFIGSATSPARTTSPWSGPETTVPEKGAIRRVVPAVRARPGPQLPQSPIDRAHDREDFIPDVNNSSYRY
jgi:hypothetical protein